MSQTKQTSGPFVSEKEPWLAVNLSLFFPGLGQIYAGKVGKGHILIGTQLLLYGLSGWLIVSPAGNIGIGSMLLLAALSLSIWTIYDSYSSAQNQNSSSSLQLKQSSKDPWLAVFLSRLVPGMGHLYIGKVWLSVLIFTFFIFSLLVQLVPILLSAMVAYHVYITSPVRREKSQYPILILCICSILITILIAMEAFWIKTNIAEPHYISTNSMMPTLQMGDRVFINKQTYRLQAPQRGDIVLFSPPEKLQNQNFQEALVKRAIGLPGERVEVQNGRVYINDQPLEENYLEQPPLYKSPPVTVPPNSYLVLGDNRNSSYDSLDWGFVPRSKIIGKVSKRFWPPQRLGAVR
ncbi:MAG TPA: signal peptidase I [Cyanobacteria bacterium UBA8803]|nr:signal peptidase I [Cyanobacteria bacterium UBA9273]HBL58649.1 signal peptidase I [Cyanobacteria bacterium UBA8803]